MLQKESNILLLHMLHLLISLNSLPSQYSSLVEERLMLVVILEATFLELAMSVLVEGL
jgi:hypothetical protein